MILRKKLRRETKDRKKTVAGFFVVAVMLIHSIVTSTFLSWHCRRVAKFRHLQQISYLHSNDKPFFILNEPWFSFSYVNKFSQQYDASTSILSKPYLKRFYRGLLFEDFYKHTGE